MIPGLPLFPEAASSIAGRVDALFWFLVGLTALISVGIFVLIVVFSLRFRRRAPNEIGAPIHGSMKLEALWIAAPFFLSLVIFGWGAHLFVAMRQVPPQAMEIFVVAKQWMWKSQHPGGQTEINELHVPVGRDIQLTMTSEDVIHSFYVPAFRVKMDVLPGRYTTLWFQPTEPGEYHLFCAEYCGTNHSRMGGVVRVLEPAAFEAWLAGGDVSGGSVAEAGARIFQQYACHTCHLELGEGRGPSLAGLYGSTVRLEDGSTVTADDNYLRESILDPRRRVVEGYPPIMPAYRGVLSEEAVMQLVAYIRSLGAQSGGIQPGGAQQPTERQGAWR